MTPEERANRIMDDIANNCSSLQDVASEIRQAENDALEQAARLAASFFDRYDEGTQCANSIAAAIRGMKHVSEGSE